MSTIVNPFLGWNELLNIGVNNRLDFYLYVECRNGNPNGDPDQDNRPRTDPYSEHGMFSDVALKHKFRMWIHETYKGQEGMGIYVAPGLYLRSKNMDIRAEVKKRKLPNTVESARAVACELNYDIRTWGGVTAGNEGTECGSIRGPMQLEFGTSLSPIDSEIMSISLTRCVQSKPKSTKDQKSKNKKSEIEDDEPITGESRNGTFGSRWLIPYVVHRFPGHFNPMLVRDTGFSNQDMRIFWETIDQMLSIDASAARPYLGVRRIIVFEHFNQEDPTGICTGRVPLHRLEKLINTTQLVDQSPRCFEDYHIELSNNIPAGIRVYDIQP